MQEISKVIQKVVQDLFGEQVEVSLTRTDEQFGDFATNIALQLGKQLAQNPRDVAQQIVEKLASDSVARATVAGPGFINITLTEVALLNLVKQSPQEVLKDKVVLAEYSDPNPLHWLGTQSHGLLNKVAHE